MSFQTEFSNKIDTEYAVFEMDNQCPNVGDVDDISRYMLLYRSTASERKYARGGVHPVPSASGGDDGLPLGTRGVEGTTSGMNESFWVGAFAVSP